MMMSSKQCVVPEALKPGSVSMADSVKAKLPVVIMPLLLIFIVYSVDSMLSMVGSSSSKSDEATSTYTNHFLEMILLIACVLIPLVFFSFKGTSSKVESKVPSASDASARLRAKVAKSSEAQESGASPTMRLSEKLLENARTPIQTQSKTAVNLARWNQAINNAAKASSLRKLCSF